MLSGLVCIQQGLGTRVPELWALTSSTKVGPLVYFLQTPLGVTVPSQTGSMWRVGVLRGVYLTFPVPQV